MTFWFFLASKFFTPLHGESSVLCCLFPPLIQSNDSSDLYLLILGEDLVICRFGSSLYVPLLRPSTKNVPPFVTPLPISACTHAPAIFFFYSSSSSTPSISFLPVCYMFNSKNKVCQRLEDSPFFSDVAHHLCFFGRKVDVLATFLRDDFFFWLVLGLRSVSLPNLRKKDPLGK